MFFAAEVNKRTYVPILSIYLSHGIGQDLNNLLVRSRHDALAVDLDDAVTDADATSLSDTASHQTADLHRKETEGFGLVGTQPIPNLRI